MVWKRHPFAELKVSNAGRFTSSFRKLGLNEYQQNFFIAFVHTMVADVRRCGLAAFAAFHNQFTLEVRL